MQYLDPVDKEDDRNHVTVDAECEPQHILASLGCQKVEPRMGLTVAAVGLETWDSLSVGALHADDQVTGRIAHICVEHAADATA